MECGYLSPYWVTYKQAKELGAHVRKGERGKPVVYANTITKTEEQDDGTEEERKIPFMKAYTVFNVEQIEDLPAHYYVKPEPVIDPAERIEHADAFFAKLGADIRHGGKQAYYSCGTNHVQMPVFECFRSAEAYYATLAHELPSLLSSPRHSAQENRPHHDSRWQRIRVFRPACYGGTRSPSPHVAFQLAEQKGSAGLVEASAAVSKDNAPSGEPRFLFEPVAIEHRKC